MAVGSLSQGTPKDQAVLYGLAMFVTLLLIGYSVATVWYSLTGAMEHYTIHVTLVLVLVTLDVARYLNKMEPSTRVKAQKLITYFLSLAIIACGFYFVAQAKELEFTQPFIVSWISTAI